MMITIDGPAGTGKSTIAKNLAMRLGFTFFDTGAMYRAVALAVIRNRVLLNDQEAVSQLLRNFQYSVDASGETPRYFLNGEDVTEAIRTAEVTLWVSPVSAIEQVRQVLVALQRSLAEGKDAVFEGRDMGTVAFPQAELKVFLTADPKVRAQRRYDELHAKGRLPKDATVESVLEEIQRRDTYDSGREIAPLRPAEDAHLIDTSQMSIEQVVDAIVALMPRSSS